MVCSGADKLRTGVVSRQVSIYLQGGAVILARREPGATGDWSRMNP
jgi:hypothetical protein